MLRARESISGAVPRDRDKDEREAITAQAAGGSLR